MQFKTLHGINKKLVKAHKYRVDWHGQSRSKIQYKVKQCLWHLWKNHIVLEEMPVVGTKLSLDFYNANKKIAVEVQGQQHNKYVPFFHGKNKINYISQLSRDHQKKEFCELNDIRLVEIYYGDKITIQSIASVINNNE